MRNRTSIEKHINNFLLKPITFKLNNKVVKKGKLKIFTIKQFFIKFNLEINNEIKVFEVPYPYKIHNHGDCLMFEYTLSSFCHSSNSDLFYKLKTTNKSNCNKMYDNFLYMLTE